MNRPRGRKQKRKLKKEIGTALKIVRQREHCASFHKGVVPLCFVDPARSTIGVIAEGWLRASRLQGFPSLRSYFSTKRGIEAFAFAISHESIHQLLYSLEGKRSCFSLDLVSGAGEVV